MKFLLLLLVVFTISIHSQTIAWRGVSDLGGNGLAIVTGSQTVSADGSYSSSSSSSSSNIPSGYSSYSSTPRTTWTVASTSPLNVVSTSTPTTRTSSTQNTAASRSARPSTTSTIATTSQYSVQSPVGSWIVTEINGYPTQCNVTIDSNQIGFTYCNTKGFDYFQTGNSISVSSNFSTKKACANMYPTEASVDNAFLSATTYSLSGTTLRLINKNSQTTVTLIKN